jgi:Fe-S-cluster containining protein
LQESTLDYTTWSIQSASNIGDNGVQNPPAEEVNEITGIKSKTVEQQNGFNKICMILCKDVLHAWQFVYRKAQIKLYKEISLCYFIIRAWQKMLCRIYFRRRMKYKQKMFWLRNLQEETAIIQKRIVRTLWNSFIVKL